MKRISLLFCWTFLLAVGVPVIAAEVPQVIGELAEQRSNAESSVLLAKHNVREGLSSAEDLTAIRKSYNEAKAAFDRYLAELKSTLASGGPVDLVQPYLDRAVQKNQEFVKLAEAYNSIAELKMRADNAARAQGPAGGGAPATAIGKGLLAAGPLLLDATKAI
jgi:ABC-type branched-subunit amino acid transport system ATPase component